MRVRVDLKACSSHGECCFVAPDVFELDDDDVLIWEAEPDEAQRPAVLQAIAVCPMQAISLED
jgi:ferredoxin